MVDGKDHLSTMLVVSNFHNGPICSGSHPFMVKYMTNVLVLLICDFGIMILMSLIFPGSYLNKDLWHTSGSSDFVFLKTISMRCCQGLLCIYIYNLARIVLTWLTRFVFCKISQHFKAEWMHSKVSRSWSSPEHSLKNILGSKKHLSASKPLTFLTPALTSEHNSRCM